MLRMRFNNLRHARLHGRRAVGRIVSLRSSSPAPGTWRFWTNRPAIAGATCRSAPRVTPWAARSSTRARPSPRRDARPRPVGDCRAHQALLARSLAYARKLGLAVGVGFEPYQIPDEIWRALPPEVKPEQFARDAKPGARASTSSRHGEEDARDASGAVAWKPIRTSTTSGCGRTRARIGKAAGPEFRSRRRRSGRPTTSCAARAGQAPGGRRLGRRSAPFRRSRQASAQRCDLLLSERTRWAGTRSTRSSASWKAASAGPFRGWKTIPACGWPSSTSTASTRI